MATDAENDVARLVEEAASELLEAMPAARQNLRPHSRETRHLGIFAPDGFSG